MDKVISHRTGGIARFAHERTALGNPALSETVEKHVHWLLEGPIRMSDGMLAAWTDRNRPSYPYEESTGYLITMLCHLFRLTGQGRFFDEAARSVRALVDSAAKNAGFGRDGVHYLFDTAVCLRAIGTFFATFKETGHQHEFETARRLVERMALKLNEMFRSRLACTKLAADGEPERWSETFNVHLVKAIQQVRSWIDEFKKPADLNGITENLIAGHYRDGLFRTDPLGDSVLLHPHCYTVEGLLASEGRQRGERGGLSVRAASKLAEIQTPEGGLPNCWPINGESWLASDVTAQAVRIWQCVDPAAYKNNISAGLAFLSSMAHRSGGIVYSSRIGHVNSWATIFTVQAMIWRDTPAEAGWII